MMKGYERGVEGGIVCSLTVKSILLISSMTRRNGIDVYLYNILYVYDEK